jgi:hypothetical protein
VASATVGADPAIAEKSMPEGCREALKARRVKLGSLNAADAALLLMGMSF